MRILLVTDNRYWRQSIGSQKRIATLCDHLARNHQLEVLFLGSLAEQDRKQLDSVPRTYQRVIAAVADQSPTTPGKPGKYVALRRSVKQTLVEFRRLVSSPGYRKHSFRRISLQLNEPKPSDFHHPDWAGRFSEACRRVVPDAIIVEYVRLAWLLEHCSDSIPPDCRIAIDTHDVQHRRQSLFHENGQTHDLDITPHEEARALSLCHAAIAIQKEDARELRRLQPGIEVIVAAHPHPVIPLSEPHGMPIRFAFFGSSMAPNRDALEHLALKLWPAVRQSLGPDTELLIFGNVGDSHSTSTRASGIRIEGFAPDLLAAYSSVHVVVNPVAYGGGLKIKSVEALCLGKPLITTATGAEGLDEGVNTAFIQADSDADFVAAMIELARSPERRNALSSAALAFARNNFAPDHAFDELDAFLMRRSGA